MRKRLPAFAKNLHALQIYPDGVQIYPDGLGIFLHALQIFPEAVRIFFAAFHIHPSPMRPPPHGFSVLRHKRRNKKIGLRRKIFPISLGGNAE